MCRMERLSKKAQKAALNSNMLYRLGAIVFKGGKILSWGYNHNNTHAEAHALNKVKKAYGASIFVARVSPTGLAMAKPCNNCMKILSEKGIKRIFYTTRNGIEEMRN